MTVFIGDVEKSVREALLVHRSLVTLLPDGTLQLKAVHSAGARIDTSRLKGLLSYLLLTSLSYFIIFVFILIKSI